MVERVMGWVMGCALVPVRVVLMGLWVLWWIAATLGMGKGVSWGYQVVEMVVMIIVVEMGL